MEGREAGRLLWQGAVALCHQDSTESEESENQGSFFGSFRIN